MTDFTRRSFLGAAGAALSVPVAAATTVAAPTGKLKILGINSSPRKGKTTSAALAICLEAAGAVSPDLQTELVELADYQIPAQLAAGLPLRPGEQDDFPKLLEKLNDPQLAGLIVGSPTYFGAMSALCKAFLDRCVVLRKPFTLANKVAGVVAVGGARNGGQELVIQNILNVLMCHEMLVVGDGRPTAHRGATLWNTKDNISGDEFGINTAKNLGRRVAEVVLNRPTA